jgi:membrane protein implicated in regulation of membrane protease activity
MTQSRLISFAEALTNTVVGFLVALSVQVLASPLFGIEVGLSENIALAILFTAVSIARSYAPRRLFERLRRPRDAARSIGRWLKGHRGAFRGSVRGQ